MKKSINFIFGAVILLMAVSCNKVADLPGTTKSGQLIVSSTTVKINQPDSLLLTGANGTDSVRWSVVPAGFDSIFTRKNAAVIFFKRAGNYKVTAAGGGVSPASVSINVSDSVYRKHPVYNVTSLAGDQITLVPYYHSSPNVDSTYITLVAQTHRAYCGTSRLNVADSVINNKYGINFLNVVQPSPCVIGDSPIAAVLNLTTQFHQLQNGTFPLSASLNGQIYTGSIVVTSTTIIFNWDYSSGIIMAPKEIRR